MQSSGAPLSGQQASVSTCFTYDAKRRLTKIDQYAAQGSLVSCSDTADRVALAEFGYDHFDRRVTSKVFGVQTFAIHGPSGELLSELDANGHVLRSYVYGTCQRE
jgi:hypothetical protein